MGVMQKISNLFKGKKTEGKRAFQAATQDRLTSSWTTSLTNINYDIRVGNKILRSRARDLAENDPHAKKFLRMLDKNVIGPDGFAYRNTAYDMKKNADGEWEKVYDALANNILKDMWDEWTKPENCTITGDVSFREASALELKTIAVDGEVFLKLISNKNANKFGFTYQILDAALCDEGYNSVNPKTGNQIIMGIEYNSYMKPVAYYFRKTDSKEIVYNGTYYSQDYVRIPAEQIIHLYRKEFVGQLRGISWFLPVAYRMNILKGYQEAVLLNARSAAMKTGVLVPKDSASALTEANIAGGDEDEDGNIVQPIEPGETYIVPEGYDWNTYDPTYPSGSEGPFTTAVLQAIASGFDVDYPTLASDFSRVNYTSSRAALLDARAGYKILQKYLIDHKLKRIHTELLNMAILTGAVNLPVAKIEKFDKPEFVGYKGDWVDQWKENKADAYAVQNGLESYANVIAKRGYNLEQMVKQIKYEKELFEKNNLEYPGTKDSPQEEENSGGNPTDDSIEQEEKNYLKLFGR